MKICPTSSYNISTRGNQKVCEMRRAETKRDRNAKEKAFAYINAYGILSFIIWRSLGAGNGSGTALALAEQSIFRP